MANESWSATSLAAACRTKNVRELVVNVVTKAGGVDNRQRDPHTIFLELCRFDQLQWAFATPVRRGTHRR